MHAANTIPKFPGGPISSEDCVNTMNRILIIDDHAPYRDALREYLSQEPDFQIVGEACNLCEALRYIGMLSPQIVLTDLTMPDAHGIEAVAAIRRHYPDLKILVVSSHREREYKHRCRKAGAAGYIVKDAIHNELREGIRAVLGGKSYMGADAGNEALSNFLLDPVANKEEAKPFAHY
jgi:DNA-binding NarL/FixJ family response regulator